MNTRVKELFDRTEPELVGISVEKLLHQSDDYFASHDSVKARYLESEIIRENGERIPIEAVVTHTMVSEEVLFIAALRRLLAAQSPTKDQGCKSDVPKLFGNFRKRAVPPWLKTRAQGLDWLLRRHWLSIMEEISAST